MIADNVVGSFRRFFLSAIIWRIVVSKLTGTVIAASGNITRGTRVCARSQRGRVHALGYQAITVSSENGYTQLSPPDKWGQER